MRVGWSCPGILRSAVILAGGLAASASFAATVEYRRITLDLQPASYLETQELQVRLDGEGDLESWDRYPIYLDDHIALEEVRAEVLNASGAVLERVPQRRFETYDSPGGGLYNSGKLEVIPFAKLEVGQQLRIRVVTRTHSLFPASWIPLAMEDEQLRLQVKVRGGGERLRWHLRGDSQAFRAEQTSDGLEVKGEGIAGFERGAFAPSSGSGVPALQLSWDEGGSWAEVGDWYLGLTAGVPRDRNELKSVANRLTEGLSSNRQKVEALSTYVKSKVRYEAVEIGAGRLVPSPSSEVLNRGWGDCKDKAELLVGLLDEVGIPSHIALLRAGRGERIETSFPSPYQFNHAIVAVSARAAEPEASDPVSEGLLFVDPTSAWGEIGWLHSASQGHHALVVDPAGSRLVRTPDQLGAEISRLAIDGEVSDAGGFSGKLTFRVDGDSAIPWIRDMASRPREATLSDFLGIVHRVAPGAEMLKAGWQDLETAVPGFILQGDVQLPDAVRGDAGRRWLRAAALGRLPEPSVLDERTQPVVLSLGSSITHWRLRVPESWCPPVDSLEEVTNEVGRFSRRVSSSEAGVVDIQQTVTLEKAWVEEEQFGALKELALAESRAKQRRIRLRCSSESSEPASPSAR